MTANLKSLSRFGDSLGFLYLEHAVIEQEDSSVAAFTADGRMRDWEGARVRDAYAAAVREWGVPWSGREYDRTQWSASDPVNRALSAANAALYAVCSAGLHALGYSPALGFIHTGKQLSFVYDLADIYKLETTVPAAFEAAAQGATKVEARARECFRRLAWQQRLPDKITKALSMLFGPAVDDAPADADPAAPGPLYDPGGAVAGGIRHVGDDS